MKPTTERQFSKAWTSTSPPQRMLAIRFHALGDVAVTLPFCMSLHHRLPSTQFDYLTAASFDELPKAAGIFDAVLSIPFSGGRWSRLTRAILTGWRMRKRGYDIVFDLQRNWMSRIIRILASPAAWGEFDRFSSQSAGARTQAVFHDAGFQALDPRYLIESDAGSSSGATQLLEKSGWNMRSPLVVLNPAGLWESRNWPLEYYCDLARMWLDDEPVQFLIMGTDRLRDKAEYLQSKLGTSVINLVEQTSITMAFALLKHAAVVISEDSGLHHMSWISGIPTIALFGSSRSDWSRPLGSHSLLFSSEDLECGECMDPECRYGDVHCLTRYSPRVVYEAARKLLSTHQSRA